MFSASSKLALEKRGLIWNDEDLGGNLCVTALGNQCECESADECGDKTTCLQALADLGLSPQVCQRIGLRVLKVGMVWPMESASLQTFAENLDDILVIEEKRQVLEYQVKEELFGWMGRGKKIPRVSGKFDEQDGGEWAVPQGRWLLPAHYEFSPAIVARAIGTRLLRFALPES